MGACRAVPTGAAVPTCAASKAGVGGPHLHAHQQARARSSTRTSMLGPGVQAQQVHADAGACKCMRDSSAVVLHVGQALLACGSGG